MKKKKRNGVFFGFEEKKRNIGFLSFAKMSLLPFRLHYPGYLIISLTASATMLSFAGTMTSWVRGKMKAEKKWREIF